MKNSKIQVLLLIITIVISSYSFKLFLKEEKVIKAIENTKLNENSLLDGPPGVLGEPAELVLWGRLYEYGRDYVNLMRPCYSIPYPSHIYYGLKTRINVEGIHDIELFGPESMNPTIDHANLGWNYYLMYRPCMIIRTDAWYDHSFEFTTTALTYDIALATKKGSGQAGFSYYNTHKTITDKPEEIYGGQVWTGWWANISHGQTAVVYFLVGVLSIMGDVTYNNGKTIHYDVLALQYIDFFNYVLVMYEEGEEIAELPEGLTERSCYDERPPFGIPDTFTDIEEEYMPWDISKEYANSFLLDFKLNYPPENWWTSASLDIKIHNIPRTMMHTFTSVYEGPPGNQTPVPRPLDYYIFKYENVFSTNLLTEQNPVATIITPINGSILSDTTGVIITGQDNSETVNARLWISNDSHLNEEVDIEITDIYTIHLDDNWFMGFNSNEFPDGIYYLIARVYDRFGAYGTTNIQVEIKNDK